MSREEEIRERLEATLPGPWFVASRGARDRTGGRAMSESAAEFQKLDNGVYRVSGAFRRCAITGRYVKADENCQHPGGGGDT